MERIYHSADTLPQEEEQEGLEEVEGLEGWEVEEVVKEEAVKEEVVKAVEAV